MNTNKRKVTFPIGLYEHLVRKANSAVEDSFMTISFPIFTTQFFELKRKGNWATIDWLFKEMAQRLTRIINKYSLELELVEGRKNIRIDYNIQKTYREIKISGFNYIPIKSFGNLITIVIWSYLVFTTQDSPAESAKSKEKLKRYETSFEQFKNYWNSKPRKRLPNYENLKCYICGELATSLNSWLYKTSSTDEPVFTPVCEKHLQHLI